jgi:hypothetical protein
MDCGDSDGRRVKAEARLFRVKFYTKPAVVVSD